MRLPEAFRAQGKTCAQMGSPFMDKLCQVLAESWRDDTALSQACAAFEGDIGPAGHSLPLRIAGGLHALVLSHAEPALAAVYPPHTASEADLQTAVLDALSTHEPFLLEWIQSPPQTNEVRRSAALIAGAQVALQHFNLPLVLSELGASGGLNLMWDHYALDVDGTRFGPNVPAVLFSPRWDGPPPPKADPIVAARAGVDLNPLNPALGDHLLRLTAYLWPDQPERLAMTRAAASIATTVPVQGDAIEWLGPRLASAPQGHLHLVQHTVTWQYFPAAIQARGRALIEAAGQQATASRPLGWLSMEADGNAQGMPGAAVVLRLWPGDLNLALGRADFHGRWVQWAYDSTASG